MIRQGSKLKNKLSITSLIGLAIFTIIFLSWYGGSYIQIAFGIIGFILCLSGGIFLICKHELKLIPFAILGALLNTIGILGRYLDAKRINDDYLLLAVPIIVMVFFIYLYIIGEKNDDKKTKTNLKLAIVGSGIFELFLIYITFFMQH